MSMCAIDFAAMISDRARSIDVSGIRRVFELGATLKDPINLSIGQPDFPVPDPMKQAAISAIERDHNGYTLTQGLPALRRAVESHLAGAYEWSFSDDAMQVMVTSGTSGGLLLSFLAMLDPGDEAIIPDPYFVIYPALRALTGVNIVYCDTYPDFRMTAERIEPLITDRTRLLLLNSPGNPTGTVLHRSEIADLVDLCRTRGIVIVSDEIYDEFTYDDACEDGRCPSPAELTRDMVLIRGFGKSYGCTGWRMGYAAGPAPVIGQMSKLQQYTFVCAPSIAQHGCLAAFESDITGHVAAYQGKRDMVVERLGGLTSISEPGGAFYVFIEVPKRLGMTGTAFAERLIDRNVLVIPGGVFSRRDTHIRISYAVSDAKLKQGLDIIAETLAG